MIVGNAPFGADVITEKAKSWANSDGRNWSIPNNDIGGLFLAKCAQLVTGTGKVGSDSIGQHPLVQPWQGRAIPEVNCSPRHYVEAVYNLSALRHRVFKRRAHTEHASVAPVCVIVLNRRKPAPADRITYVSPKHLRQLLDEFVIVVEPGDSRWLTVGDATADPAIWSKLMWGSNRDLQLIRKLGSWPDPKEARSRRIGESPAGREFRRPEETCTVLQRKENVRRQVAFRPLVSFGFETADLPIVSEHKGGFPRVDKYGSLRQSTTVDQAQLDEGRWPLPGARVSRDRTRQAYCVTRVTCRYMRRQLSWNPLAWPTTARSPSTTIF